MPNTIPVSFICPKCGHAEVVQRLTIIDGNINGKEKTKLLNGNFFTIKCKKCDEISHHIHPTMYIDDAKCFVIFFVNENKDELDVLKMVGKRMLEPNKCITYQYRIVNSANQLREKVRIFDEGFDDRIVEIVKYCAINRLCATNQIGRTDEILCWIHHDGTLEFEIFGEENKVYQVKKEFYQYIEERCAKYLSNDEMDNLHIDLDWAIDFLCKNNLLFSDKKREGNA